MTRLDVLLGTGETTSEFFGSGYIDFWIVGLTEGTVKLQFRFNRSNIENPSVWRDFPEGAFISDVAKTVWIGEDYALLRAVGVGNNAGVYVRFGRDG